MVEGLVVMGKQLLYIFGMIRWPDLSLKWGTAVRSSA